MSFVNDSHQLKGKRALVTGGSRGIAAAIVQRLVAAGAHVVTTTRNPVGDFPASARAATVFGREHALPLAAMRYNEIQNQYQIGRESLCW